MTPRDAARWVLTDEINTHGRTFDWRAVARVVKRVTEVSGCSLTTAKDAVLEVAKGHPSITLTYSAPNVRKRAPKKKAKRRRKIS